MLPGEHGVLPEQCEDPDRRTRFRRSLHSVMAVEQTERQQELLRIRIGRVRGLHRWLLIVENGDGERCQPHPR